MTGGRVDIYIMKHRTDNTMSVYVGSTTDLKRRKRQHKYHCSTPTSDKHMFRMYKYVRDNGGFENWDITSLMNLINPTDTLRFTLEQHLITQYNATLNTKFNLV
jgi:hypothetical protein